MVPSPRKSAGAPGAPSPFGGTPMPAGAPAAPPANVTNASPPAAAPNGFGPNNDRLKVGARVVLHGLNNGHTQYNGSGGVVTSAFACLEAAEVHLDPPHDKTLLFKIENLEDGGAAGAALPAGAAPTAAAAGGGGPFDDPFDDPFADLEAAEADPATVRYEPFAAIDPFAAMRDVPPPPPPPAPAPAAAAPPCRPTDNPWDGVDVQELETAAVDEAKRAEEAAVDHCTRANSVEQCDIVRLRNQQQALVVARQDASASFEVPEKLSLLPPAIRILRETKAGVPCTRQFEDLAMRDKLIDKAREDYNLAQSAVRNACVEDRDPRLSASIEARDTSRGALLRELQNAISVYDEGAMQTDLEQAANAIKTISRALQAVTKMSATPSRPSHSESPVGVELTSNTCTRSRIEHLSATAGFNWCDGVAAYDDWVKAHDCQQMASQTDQTVHDAWVAIAAFASGQMLEPSEDREFIEATDRALAAMSAELDALRKYDPLKQFPGVMVYMALLTLQEHLESQREELKTLRRNMQKVQKQVVELEALPDSPDCAGLEESLLAVKQAKRALKQATRDHEDLVDDEKPQAEIDAAKQKVVDARVSIQTAQRQSESSRAEMASLVEKHFPELPRINPNLKLGASGLAIMTERSLDMYTPIGFPVEIMPKSTPRHVVEAYEFQGQRCVLKTFKLTDATQRRGFVREASLLHALAHPNVIPLEAAFEEEIARGGFVAYLQMPYYEGGTLLHWLLREENQAPMMPNGAVVDRTSELAALQHTRLLSLVLSALAHVHAHPAVHGDVKPEV